MNPSATGTHLTGMLSCYLKICTSSGFLLSLGMFSRLANLAQSFMLIFLNTTESLCRVPLLFYFAY